MATKANKQQALIADPEPVASPRRRWQNQSVAKHWREEVAAHLVAAAQDLRARHDGSFAKSFAVALGYLEHAARTGLSRNAQRCWEAVTKSLKDGEHTVQMKLTPDEVTRLRASDPDISPPSLPVAAPAPDQNDD